MLLIIVADAGNVLVETCDIVKRVDVIFNGFVPPTVKTIPVGVPLVVVEILYSSPAIAPPVWIWPYNEYDVSPSTSL